MKPKHWRPLIGGDKSLRGRDEWERIVEMVRCLCELFDRKGMQELFQNDKLLVPCLRKGFFSLAASAAVLVASTGRRPKRCPN